MRSTNGVALRRLALTVAACLPLAARAADRPVRMQVPPPAGDAAAMPVIADPADDAERRINAAAKRLDTVLRAAMAACKAEGGTKYDWERSVDVTMRGPGFLSYTISDNT